MIPFLKRNGRGIILIVATYFYFLIFAQFAFIELLNVDHSNALQSTMGAMAAFGILGSLLTPLVLNRLGAAKTLTLSILGCGATAALATSSHNLSSFLILSAGTGLFLGLLTVALTASLRSLLSPSSWGLAIGVGTGTAYALANAPVVFIASPAVQSLIACVVVLLGLSGIRGMQCDEVTFPPVRPTTLTYFPYAVLIFLALVWLDSAAFYIIQHTQELKDNSWADIHLWRNAIVHFSFALLAGYILQKHRATILTMGAFLLLAVASLCLNHSEVASIGGWLYPAGVSLYSTALVACPVYLSRVSKSGKSLSPAWSAAILYSIAGWFGSANGIGMAKSLSHIPPLFLIIAGIIFCIPAIVVFMRNRRLESIAVLALLIIAAVLLSTKSPPHSVNSSAHKTSSEPTANSIQLGRQVYLKEGCIHCHSHYVRPNSRDVDMWGPHISFDKIKDENPVIIGNRRAGPDLLNVGNRRSRAWLKQHFIHPQSLSHRSPMPTYAHLFRDGNQRGEHLIDFLTDVSSENLTERFRTTNSWIPEASEILPISTGHQLFSKLCTTCHGATGLGDGALHSLWARPPANLVEGPFNYSLGDDQEIKINRIIKFGIMRTDMPGHETLSDDEVIALGRYVLNLRQ